MNPLPPSAAPEAGQGSVPTAQQDRARKGKAAAPVGFEVLLALLAPVAGQAAVLLPQGLAVKVETPGGTQAKPVNQAPAADAPQMPNRPTAALPAQQTATAGDVPPVSTERPLPREAAAALGSRLSAEELRLLAGQQVSVAPLGSEAKAALASARSAASAWLANLSDELPEGGPLQQTLSAKTSAAPDSRSYGEPSLESGPPIAKGQQSADAAGLKIAGPPQALKELSDAVLRSSQKEAPAPQSNSAAPPPLPPAAAPQAQFEAQIRALPQALPVPEQVALALTKALDGERDRISIKLHPAELGRIHIKLDLGQDGTVRAVIAADRPETLELLQRDARGLERALEQAGLRTDSGGLSFDLSGGNRFRPEEELTAAPPPSQDDPAAETVKPARRGERRHDGLVSISA